MTADIELNPVIQRPANDARITEYRVMPWPDGTRVTVEMGLTPFKQLPAMEISILSLEGQVLQSCSVLGTIERRPAPTLHLPTLEQGTRLAVLIEMLDADTVVQKIIVPFQVAGPIIKRVVQNE